MEMDSARKAAIRAFKERKIPRGIFAIRCDVTGGVWVDSAMDLVAAENRTWLTLRHGDLFIEKTVLEEFRAHGRDAFRFEVLETLEDDVAPLLLRDLLKERKLHWVAKLEAKKLSPV